MFTHGYLACVCAHARRRGLFCGRLLNQARLVGWLVAGTMALTCNAAAAHGIAGNRLFPGTLTFDDPAVADEAVLPDFSSLNRPAQGSNVVENRINWSFVRLLTPTLAVSIDSSWIHQNWPIGQTSGFGTTDIGLKYEAFRNNEHEALVSVGLAWGIGQSGAQAVGADEPNTIQPAVFFGKGFGDLPDWLSWARPLRHNRSNCGRAAGRPQRQGACPRPHNRKVRRHRRSPSPNPALGLFHSIQHLLSDQPVHRRTAQARAA
jgi:hypothetical protein